MSTTFTHFDNDGNAIMVDVSDKPSTIRTATAQGRIRVSAAVIEAILNKTVRKGDVLSVARLAGIMAAKRTSDLIPLCHPLCLSHLSIDFSVLEASCVIEVTCTAKLAGQTGVEMEAMTGVSAALLTIYDMCKAIDKGMEIEKIRLIHKDGGKSGLYQPSDC